MNERIKQLAEKAREQAELFNSVRNKLTAEEWEEIYNEKFAELIVKECAELTLDYKNDQYYQGWLDYRDEIKQHFGVEE